MASQRGRGAASEAGFSKRSVLGASWGVLEASWKRPGGLLGRPWRVFFSFGDDFLFVIVFRRISNPLGPHFYAIFEAATRTHQTRIWIRREAKVSIAAFPGILQKHMVLRDVYTLILDGW